MNSSEFLKAGFLPDINLQYNFDSNFNLDTSEKKLTLRQKLVDGGGTFATFSRSSHLLKAEKMRFQQLKQELALNAVKAYVNVLQKTEMLKLREHKERIFLEHLSAMKKRFSLGEVTNAEVLLAKAKFSSSISERVDAEGKLKLVNIAYYHLIGEDADDLSEANDKLPSVPELNECLQLAKTNNLSLKAAVYQKRAAGMEVIAESSKWLPSLNLSASKNFGEDGMKVDKLLENVHVVFTLDVLIFKRGVNAFGVSKAKMDAKKSTYDYYETVKNIEQAVVNAWNNVLTAKAIIKASQEAEKAAALALEGVEQEVNLNLKKKKVKVDEQTSGDVNSKFTALHIAALHGHQEIVQLLLNNNANPSLKDSQGRTPRDIVGDVEDDTLEREQAIRERDAVEQKLQEAEQRYANNRKRIEQPGHNQHSEQYGATYNGEQTFLNKSNSESDAEESELTPLHYAARYGYVEIAEYLIDNGAGVDAQDKDGVTPLHYAAAKSAKESVKLLIKRKANVNAQDKDGHTPLYFAVAKDNKELAKLLIKYGADRSLIKDEGLKGYTSSHSKTHNATETPEEAEKVKKSKVKSKELRAQLKEENQSLKRKIQDLESEKATLKDKLDKTKTKEVLLEKKQKELKNDIAGQEARLEALEQEIQELGNENTKLKDKLDKTESQYSKAEALLEKTQKELAESKSCIVGHETKLKQFNKENESLTQKIKSLENENTPLEGELGKTKTNEVSLEKAGKRQMSFLKVASVNLVTMLTVGATLSIAFDLSVLPIIVVFVTSAALLASCVTYAISKPIAEPKPTTELKEVDIQGSAQRCL
uniref:Uncharacterized protein n=1 Tax=Glossina morsitans morsitans TaxID=37546 RepID=A0A1B0FAU7_GLOMM